MDIRKWTILVLGMLLFSLPLCQATETKEQALEKAMDYLKQGSYELAERYLGKSEGVTNKAERLEALINLSLLTGKREKALEYALLLSQSDKQARGLMYAGEIELDRGFHDQAYHYFRSALLQDPRNVRIQADVGRYYQRLGKKNEYIQFYSHIFDNYDPNINYTPEELTYIGKACRAYAMNSDEVARTDTLQVIIQQILQEAIDKDKYYFPAYIEMANIFLESYNPIEAKKVIEEALELNSQHPGLLLEKAKIQAQRYSTRQESMPTLEHVLNINPNSSEALTVAARIHLTDEEYDEAIPKLDKALQLNPNYLEARAILAAYHFLRNDSKKYQQEMDKILEINPNYGDAFYVVADVISFKRQYQDSIRLLRKAIELNPFLWEAYISLGTNLMHFGKIEEAKKNFLKVQEEYNFHTQTHNMLLLLDKYKEFKLFDTPNFTIRLHVSEADLMYPLVADLLEEAYEKLSQQYQFDPKTPITFEMFPDHADFSVRTIGLGAIPANGACFGEVVVADSPRSQPLGSFNWASVVWHEFAHVITLQLSDYQVPRWFTEGLSEYAERQRRPGTIRKLDEKLYSVHTAGLMRGIKDLNAGFTRPRYMAEVEVCYYQAGLICYFLDQNFGFTKIRKMLELYAEEKTTIEVLELALGLSPKEFDKRFLKWLDENIFSKINVSPAIAETKADEYRDLLEENPEDIDSYIELAIYYLNQHKFRDAEINAGYALMLDPTNVKAYEVLGRIDFLQKKYDRAMGFLKDAVEMGSKNFRVRLYLALLYYQKKQFNQAIKYFKAARESFPNYVGPNNPYKFLEAIYRAQNKPRKAQQELQRYLDLDANAFEPRIKLAKEYNEQGDYQKALRLLVEAQDIYPFHQDLQVLMGDISRKLQNMDEAIRAYQAVLALNPKEEKEKYHTYLAELFFEKGNISEARAHAQKAQAINSSYQPAQEILEKIRNS